MIGKKQNCHEIAAYSVNNQIREDHDGRMGGTGVDILSLWACNQHNDFGKVFSFFGQAAEPDHWVLREDCAGFFRKVIKAYPGPVKECLKSLMMIR